MRYLKLSEEGTDLLRMLRAGVDRGLAKPTFRCWLETNEFAKSPGRNGRSNGEDEKRGPEAELETSRSARLTQMKVVDCSRKAESLSTGTLRNRGLNVIARD
jgi:hypothetical protein